MVFRRMFFGGLLALIGCATGDNINEKSNFDKPVSLCSTYITSRIGYADLQVVAGLYSGTIKVSRRGEGMFDLEGSYSDNYLDAMLMACIDADLDRDRFISDSEAFNLSVAVQERYARKNGNSLE